MKILYITSIDLSRPDGPGVNEREFALSLIDRFGSGVQLLVTRPQNILKDFEGANATYLPPFSNMNPISFTWHQIALFFHALRIIRSGELSLIVTRIALFPVGLAILSIITSVPLFIRNLGGYPSELPSSKGPLKRFIWKFGHRANKRILEWISRRSQGIDVCTPGHQTGVISNLKIPSDKVVLIPNATNVKRFKIQDKQSARRLHAIDRFEAIVGYIGGRPWECGARELIEIASNMKREFPRIGFLIAGGEGPRFTELKNYAAQKGVNDFFIFTGVIPYDEVPLLMSCLDVGIAFDSAERLRTAGNSNQKIRQYLASGIPVVTMGEENSFISENHLGEVIPQGDLSLIEHAISGLLKLSPEEKKAMQIRATEYAKEFLSTSYTLNLRIAFWQKQLVALDRRA